MVAKRFASDPCDFPGRDCRVEVDWIVVVDSSGKNFGLENRRRKRSPLELLDRGQLRVSALTRRDDPMPVGREASEHLGADGLDFMTQPGKRAAPDHPE